MCGMVSMERMHLMQKKILFATCEWLETHSTMVPMICAATRPKKK